MSTFKETDDENSGAFGEIFIDSPKASSVSSLSVQSDWVITGCDARSDQPQQASSNGCDAPLSNISEAHHSVGRTLLFQVKFGCLSTRLHR